MSRAVVLGVLGLVGGSLVRFAGHTAPLPSSEGEEGPTRPPDEWSDGKVLAAVGGIRSNQCPPFCHRCSSTDASICLVCKAAAYLLVHLKDDGSRDTPVVARGVCVHACPGRHAVRGHGIFNRQCVPRGRTLHGQIAAIVRSSSSEPSAAAVTVGPTVPPRASDGRLAVECSCGANCHSDSCGCSGANAAEALAPGIPRRGKCSVCTNSFYNYMGGCFRSCAAVPGLHESGLSVIGRQCVSATAGSTPPQYQLVYHGADPGGVPGLMFATAAHKKEELFDVHSGGGVAACKKGAVEHGAVNRCSTTATVSLSNCQERCTELKRCRGILYYRVAKRCRGFSSLGGVPVSAGIAADSYKKRRSG